MSIHPFRLFVIVGFIFILSACQNQQLNFDYYIKDLQDDIIYEIVDETSIQPFQNQFQNGSLLQDTAVQKMEYEFHFHKESISFYIEEPYIIFERADELLINELTVPLEPILEDAILYEP